jgi:hypothetical protein
LAQPHNFGRAIAKFNQALGKEQYMALLCRFPLKSVLRINGKRIEV